MLYGDMNGHPLWLTVTCALTWLGAFGTDGAQILAILPIAAKSHWNVMDAVLQTLVTRGHNVTAITPFVKPEPVANYTEVDLSELMPKGVNVPWDRLMFECSVFNNLPFLSAVHQSTCKTAFELDEFWHVIQSNK